MNYQHVLLVTDLLSDADIVAKKAEYLLVNHPETKLSILHIVKDDMVRFGYELVPASSLSGEFDGKHWVEAREKLAQFVTRNQLRAGKSEVAAAISNDKGIVNYCREKRLTYLLLVATNVLVLLLG